MTYQGKVRNGVVVFDDGEVPEEGTPVRVVPLCEDLAQAGNPFLDGLLEIAATIEGLPSDLARNHDHYLHGLP
jgi:hypothetical protein